MSQVGSRARHIVSHLVAGKAGVTGDPLEAQVGLRSRCQTLFTRASLCAAGSFLSRPSANWETVQIRSSLGAESAAASYRRTMALSSAVISIR